MTLLGCLMGVVSMAQNQSYTIRGRVAAQESSGPGVPGVTVRIANTVLATATGSTGDYELHASLAPGTYQLIFSSVGYANSNQPLTLGAETMVTVNGTLREDLIGLKEVVVTGNSVATTKQQLGNAISTVSARDLQNTAAVQVDQALQGKIAGAQITQNSGNPAGGISVRLRGTSTIVGSSEPLYIIDGVIVNNDSPQLLDLGGGAQSRLVDLNPNDIDRIEVIKGAAAAAIYGSRASNGVVQIFTKRGKSGKPSVTVSSQFITSQVRKTLPYNQYPFRFNNTNVADPAQTAVQRYDFQKDIFRRAYGTENYASVSGGSEATRYYLSGSYFKNQGIIDKTDFERATGRVRLQQTLTNWASVSGGANYTLSDSRDIPNGGINEAYGALTGFIFGNNYVNPRPDPVTGIYPSVNATGIVQRTNPLEAINRFKFAQRTSRFVGDVQLNLTPFAGFTADYVLGFDTYTQLATAFIPRGNTTPSFGTGFARRADRTVFQSNQDLNLGYRHNFTEWLESTTAAGGTIQLERQLSTGITAQQLGIGAETVNNGTPTAVGEFRSQRTIQGFFVQQTLGLGQRLYLTGAVRVDAASSFGVKDRSQTYYKGSASYLLSNEKFWSDGVLGRAVPTFKLRASVGQAGNLTAIGAYDRFTNYVPVSVGGLNGVYSPAQIGNANIAPERQREVEAGVDASLLKDRLGFEVTYFDKRVTDLLLNRTFRPTYGYNNGLQNVGTMTNKGIEFLVRAAPVRSDKVRWTVTGTFSHTRNRVGGIEGNGVLPFEGGFGQVAAVNGQAVGVFYSTYFARNPDGTLLMTAAGLPQRERGDVTTGLPLRNADGQPSGTVLSKVIGNPNPKYVASLINEVEVAGRLTFRVQLDAVQGFDVFDFTRRVGERDFYGSLRGYEKELRGEVPKGYSAAVFGIFENWIEDGSYVKVREASVAYMLTPKFIGLKNIRVNVTGRNLFAFTHYGGYDPEVNAAGQSTVVRGFDFVEVPIPRTVTMGLSATF